MKLRGAISVFLVLTAGMLLAAGSGLDAEAQVRRQLRQLGVQVGYDATGDAYTVIVSARRQCAQVGSYGSARTVCFRMAELRARHQIMNALGMAASGATTVQRGAGSKGVSTVFSTFAEREVRGCEIVAFHESCDEDGLVVALALQWRRALDRQELATDAGAVVPAPDWEKAFTQWFAGTGWRLPPPTMVFVDGNGFVHRLGVGIAEPKGDGPLWNSSALKMAESFARKNLQLALYGNAEVRKTAAARMKTGGDGGASVSAYEALGTVSALGVLPQGTRDVLMQMVDCPSSLRKLMLSIYGF